MPYGFSVHGPQCNARTFPITCRYCGADVFLFMCDCGCRVLFEELGPPWPKHECMEYLATLVDPTRLPADPHIELRYGDIVRRNSTRGKTSPPQIIRRDPARAEIVVGVATVREIIEKVSIFKTMDVPEGSTIGIQLLGPLARGEFGQITLHVRDLNQRDVSSYTCFVSRDALRDQKVHRGDDVEFELVGFEVPGRRTVWHCTTLISPWL